MKSDTDPSPTPWVEKLGPGLVTGAADDDPSGIATYSQAGRSVRLRHVAIQVIGVHAQCPSKPAAMLTDSPSTATLK
jgi:hypothetical protein